MDERLEEYVELIEDSGMVVDERSGHTIALMLISYTNGFYDRTVERGEKALLLLRKQPGRDVIQKALAILIVEASGYLPSTTTGPEQKNAEFTRQDAPFLAIDLPDDKVEVKEAYDRDNALFLLFAIGVISSPPDALPLEEHLERLLITKMEYYRELE